MDNVVKWVDKKFNEGLVALRDTKKLEQAREVSLKILELRREFDNTSIFRVFKLNNLIETIVNLEKELDNILNKK